MDEQLSFYNFIWSSFNWYDGMLGYEYYDNLSNRYNN